jgi:pimeloyl-ACP methyl ester carboxylesterase
MGVLQLLARLVSLSRRPALLAAFIWVLSRIRAALQRPQITFGRHLRRPGAHPSGRLVTLSHGLTHFIVDGAENGGPLVVLVHGFVGSTGYLAPLAEYLAARGGRRVLRLDLYGRGFSECRGAPQTADLFAGQIAELLFALGETSPVDLCGYSMGGGIVARFASCFPERIRSLTIVAGIGMPSMRSALPPYLALALRVPMLRDLVGIVVTEGAKDDHKLASAWTDHTTQRCKEQVALQRERMMNEPAVARSATNSLSHMAWGELRGEFEKIAKGSFPVLVIWGDADATVPVTVRWERER